MLKAHAIIFPEPGLVTVGEVDLPDLSAEDVLVEIEFSAVSNGTERWCLTGGLNLPDAPSPAFPHVPGYQAAGVVLETGDAVKGIEPGDRVFSRNCTQPAKWTEGAGETQEPGETEGISVTSANGVPEGTCVTEATGATKATLESRKTDLTEGSRMSISNAEPSSAEGIKGVEGDGIAKVAKSPGVIVRKKRYGSWWGGHVQYHVADYRNVIKLPEGVSTYEASSLLLAQVGYNGATKPRILPGDVAVVIGEGLVGQYAGQVLRNRGAYVIMSGLQEFRLKKAAGCSADDVFNASEKDFAEYVLDRYPEGVAIVLETASKNATIRMAVELLKNGGQLVLNGFYPYPDESRLDWHWLRTKEITTYCPNSRTRERLLNTLELMEKGHVKVKELVSHECSIKEAPDVYRMLLDQKDASGNSTN
jgi:threonine dehydrogenase-like Zn-dependent dehydrogenase